MSALEDLPTSKESPSEEIFYVCTLCGEKMLYHAGPFRCKKVNCRSTNFKKWLNQEAYFCV